MSGTLGADELKGVLAVENGGCFGMDHLVCLADGGEDGPLPFLGVGTILPLGLFLTLLAFANDAFGGDRWC